MAKAGLPKKYAKMGFKKGWRAYKASKRKTRRKTRTVRRSNPRRKPKAKKKMAKRGFLNTQTIFKLLRTAALLGPAAVKALEPGATIQKKLGNILEIYTGFDMDSGQWYAHRLAEGWLPFIATTAVTYGVGKLAGMIRRL